MWKIIIETGRPHVTTMHMITACWIPKATNTKSEYVTLIAFQLQHLFQERALMLRYTYLACHVSVCQ